jgi:hypothetical protein
MKPRALLLVSTLTFALLSGGPSAVAQETASTAISPTTSTSSSVPHLVRFGGTAKGLDGKPLTATVGITFLLYSDQQGGSPLWLETQNVQPDSTGRYSVQLGVTKPDGLPGDLFTSVEARWLGVQISGQTEQPRVLLVSVPYALKAGDAETIGGLPPSAFVLANGGSAAAMSTTSTKTAPASTAASKNSPPANPAVTGKGVVDYIPMWDTTSDIIDSIIFQKSSEIGINTTTPAALLDVNGKTDIRDTLTLFPKSTDNTVAVNGTAFNISSTGKVTFISGQTFPGTGTITGITTASGSGLSGGGTTGTLSLKVPSAGITNAMLANSKVTLNASTAGGLTVPGAMTLGNTYTIGLKTCSANQVLQYSGTAWACASAGTGTVTSVASGAGLTGGPITKTGTLSIATAGVTNAMLAHSTVTVTAGTGLTGGGSVALGSSTSLSVNSAVVPELATANAFTKTNTISVSSSNPALTLSNSSGDALDITNASGDGIFVNSAGFYGLYVNSAIDGVVSYGNASGDGGYFNGGFAGIYSENDIDAAFSVAAFGQEFGATTETFGLWGYSASTSGIGTYGQSVSGSVTGSSLGFIDGVWGDTNQTGGTGTQGTVDDGFAFYGVNNSPSGFATLFVENEVSSSATSPVLQTFGSSYGGGCTIDVSGNLTCSGTLTGVVPAGNSRKLAVSSIGSAENWFEDAGSGQLSNGRTVVNIETLFGETVNTGMEYHVFLTPNGDCKGLYVAQKSPTSFEVRELGGGTSSIAFDYRIMAKRKGFEQLRLVDKTAEMIPRRKQPLAGRRPMPKPQDIRKAHEPHLKIASLAKPVVKAK